MADEGFRDRLAKQGEDALGKLAQDLLENPLVNGAISRAFEAREKATQAQEAALGALNIPSAADVERLTRRLRSVSQRLEGIEDGVDRLDQRLADLKAADGNPLACVDERLARDRGPAREARRRRRRCWRARVGRRARRPCPREQERLEVDKPADRGRASRRHQEVRYVLGRDGQVAAPRRARRARRGPARASARLERLVADPRAVPATRSRDGEHARGGDAAAGRDGQQRRRLHLDRERARARPRPRAPGIGVVEEVGGDDQPGARVRAPRAAPRAAPGRARACRSRRAPGSCRPPPARRRRPAASPSSRPSASAPQVPTRTIRRAPSVDQLLEHDRGARAAHARCSGSSAARRRPPSPE